MKNPFPEYPEITMTKKELMALVIKLNDPSSSCMLVRRGEDGKEYVIHAIESTPKLDAWSLLPSHQIIYDKFLEWEKNYD